jgi:hypothetical protein
VRQLLAASDNSSALDYPKPHRDQDAGRVPMPVVLWSGLFLLGILILILRGPTHAPAFEQLTQYRCDPLPPLPNFGYRLQSSYDLRYTCRSGERVVYQRGYPSDGSNPTAFRSCVRTGGVLRIWRYANPSPYGPYVFHSTCNDRILMYYKYRAASYETIQQFVIAVGWLVIFTSTLALGLRMYHQLHKEPMQSSLD